MSASPPELGGGCEEFVIQGVRAGFSDLCSACVDLPSFSFYAADRRYRESGAVRRSQVDPVGLGKFIHGNI